MSERDQAIRLRRTNTELDKVLEQLDTVRSSGAAKRQAERFNYRSVTVVTEVMDQSSGWTTYRTPSRNLSSTGVSLLVGKFLYPGTRCRVHLETINDRTQVIEGVVRFCRYVASTATIHEMGVQFDTPIDIELFHAAATKYRLLLVDNDEAVHKLVPRMLAKKLNTEITSASNAGEAINAALENDFDVVLLELDMPETDGMEIIRQLREKGYWRPIVALSSRAEADTEETCLQAGFSAVLNKPFQREQLHDLLVSHKDPPVMSTLGDQEDMAELVDSFVEGLPETITALEAAHSGSATDQLKALLRRLKGDAGTYGFGTITTAAAEMEQLLGSQAEATDLRAGLNRVIRLCAAARPVRGKVAETEQANEKEEAIS